MRRRKDRLARRLEKREKDAWLGIFSCSLACKADELGRTTKRPPAADAKTRFVARAIHDQLGDVEPPATTPRDFAPSVAAFRGTLYLGFAAWIRSRWRRLRRLREEGRLAAAAEAINRKYEPPKRARRRKKTRRSESDDDRLPEEVGSWTDVSGMPARVVADLEEELGLGAFWRVGEPVDHGAGGFMVAEWQRFEPVTVHESAATGDRETAPAPKVIEPSRKEVEVIVID